MYGVLSGLEGLDTFQDLMANTSLKPWYYRVKEAVQTHAGARDMWIVFIIQAWVATFQQIGLKLCLSTRPW